MKKLAVDATSEASAKSVRHRVSLPMRLNEPQSSFERMTRSSGSSSVTESGVSGESVADVSTDSSTESADEVGDGSLAAAGSASSVAQPTRPAAARTTTTGQAWSRCITLAMVRRTRCPVPRTHGG